MTKQPTDSSPDVLDLCRVLKGTDYDPLDPRHILLGEQVLLQPFKVLIGPIHMVFPRPRQLEQTEETMCHLRVVSF